MICESRIQAFLPPEDEEAIDVGYCLASDDEGLASDSAVVTTELTPEGAIELLNLKMQVAALQGELAIVKDVLRSIVPAERPSITRMPCVADVVMLTQEMFGPVEIATECDPEEDCEAFAVLTVHVSGDPADLVKKQLEWHARVRKLPSRESGAFRLCIIPQNES